VTDLPETIAPPTDTTFAVDPQIDLDAQGLLNMLTEKPVQNSETEQATGSVSCRVVLASVPEKALVANMDWELL
jgi:hypothetical protein